MCCRYYILPEGVEWDPIREGAESARILGRFRAAGQALKLSGEIRPTDLVPVLATDRSGGQRVFPMRWGFRREGGGAPLINARVETAAQKPSFREAWAAHRCAVPASWYFEWQKPPAPGGETAKFAIRSPDAAITWLCGLYRMEQGLPAFVVLTRAPGAALAEIHLRMPLILPGEVISEWINPAVPAERLLSLALTEALARRAG